MNRQKFLTLLDNPGALGADTVSELTDIISEYPFFQAARMLLVKNLHLNESIRFNNELKVSAAYISDRSKLFSLVNDLNTPSVEAANGAVSEKSDVAVVEPEKSEVVQEEVRTVEPNEEEMAPEEDSVEEVTTVGSLPVEDYFEVNDAVELEGGAVIDFSVSKEKQEDKATLTDDLVLPSADLLDYDVLPEVSGYSIEAELKEDEVNVDENRSFSEWLKVMRHNSLPADGVPKSPEPKKRSMDLIDNFLSAEPKIVPKKSPVKEQKDISSSSMIENEDLMTETLANIHISQKHYGRAIKIFEKLNLKYPEKNVYFAQRIEELQNLINNQ